MATSEATTMAASQLSPRPGRLLASAVSTLIDASGAKSASEALPVEILHNLRHQHDWTDLRLHVLHLGSGGGGSHSSEGSVGSPGGLAQDDELDARPIASSQAASLLATRDNDSTISTTDGKIAPPNPGGSASTTSDGAAVQLISGLPPRHSYMHPDVQVALLRHGVAEAAVPVQREFVLPLSLAQRWTLRRFCTVFDALPDREAVVIPGPSSGTATTTTTATATTSGDAREAATRPPYEHRDRKRVLLGLKAGEGRGGDGTVVYYIMQEGEVKPRQNG